MNVWQNAIQTCDLRVEKDPLHLVLVRVAFMQATAPLHPTNVELALAAGDVKKKQARQLLALSFNLSFESKKQKPTKLNHE